MAHLNHRIQHHPMKKVLLIIPFLLLSIGLRAQGNLQFNRVFTFESAPATITNGPNVVQSLIVPVGKIWKIEAVSLISNSASGEFDIFSILLGNSVLKSVGSGMISITNLPYWLSTGNYQLKAYVNNTVVGVIISLNVIEYNIIP
jgi:hypothetical protein